MVLTDNFASPRFFTNAEIFSFSLKIETRFAEKNSFLQL